MPIVEPAWLAPSISAEADTASMAGFGGLQKTRLLRLGAEAVETMVMPGKRLMKWGFIGWFLEGSFAGSMTAGG